MSDSNITCPFYDFIYIPLLDDDRSKEAFKLFLMIDDDNCPIMKQYNIYYFHLLNQSLIKKH